jgi:hypothetical protein
MHEMENKAISFDTLFGVSGLELEERILSAETTEKRITIIESFLLNHLADSKRTDEIVKSAN